MTAGVHQLPQDAISFDKRHNEWCRKIIPGGKLNGKLSYGRAAKLVNVYLKTLFLCEFGKDPKTDSNGNSTSARINAIHPPIDGLLLDALARNEISGSKFWAEKRSRRWTNFCQKDYEEVISSVREITKGELWRIESHWRGFKQATPSGAASR